MMLAGATFFAPHAGKSPVKPRYTITVPSIMMTAAPGFSMDPIIPLVTVSAEYKLGPHPFDDLIQEAATLHGLDPALIRAVIQTESAFDPNAVSEAGAQGLMQLMPALAEELGVRDSFDPRENILAGGKYLSQLLDAHNGNVTLALASYNAGPGAVDRYGGVPPFPETRQYVKTITQILAAEKE
jgi:soluble lytic murein transglycosylase-like protein